MDQLSAQLAARQLDERLYGQTLDSNGWNDSWIDVHLTQLLTLLLDQLSARQLEEHPPMWKSTCHSAPSYV